MSRSPGLSRAARLSALRHFPRSLGTTLSWAPWMPGVSPGEEQDWALGWRSCCCSVTQPYPTLCDLMDCSTPGLPVLHYFLEFAQTHVHWASDHPTISSSVVHFSSCPQSFPGSGSFPNESNLSTSWPKDWNLSFSISPSNECSGLIPFRIDKFDLLAVQRALKSLLQHDNLCLSILWCSAFFVVQLSHPYMATGKIIVLTMQTFLSKVMSLPFKNTVYVCQASIF